MSSIEGLIAAYDRFVRLPWDQTLAGPQKVWFAIYEPTQERRLRPRIAEFEVATKNAGHGWAHVDVTDAFAQWMAGHDYRDEYFKEPSFLELALKEEFATHVIDLVRQVLTAPEVDERTVVAVSGVGSLFGLMRVSVLVEAVAPIVRGRLLVFFPGQHDGSNYRLLDARDGWNYLAVPITAAEGS